MKLVWVNKSAGTTHGQTFGSHLIRHARSTKIHGRGHKQVLKNHAAMRSDVDATKLLYGAATCDEETVTQTEDGSTFFLITRQGDFPAKPTPSPKSSIDSLCSPAAVLDTDQKIAIRFISSVWLPTTNCIQPNRIFGSFSLVWPGDDQYANTFLSSALQAFDARSLYALLAAAARKMRLGREVMPYKAAVADLFALKAIQALRKSIPGQGPPNDQYVLDLTFLVLAELYARSPQCIAGFDVYWKMMQDHIISIGGMSKMRPVVVCFVMSINALCSFTGITLPKLDVRQHPELLGLDSMDSAYATAYSQESTMEERITSALAQLDLRSQVINETVNILSQLLGAIQKLPATTLNNFRAYLQRCLPIAVSNISYPLCLHIPTSISSSSDTLTYTNADVAHSFARLYGNVMWWWYAAVHSLPDNVRSTIEPPAVVHLAVSQAWSLLDQVEGLLKEKIWYVTSDLMLWVSALGCLVVEDIKYWKEYKRLLMYSAREKSVKDEENLAIILTRFLSLDVIDANFVEKLWFLLGEATYDRF